MGATNKVFKVGQMSQEAMSKLIFQMSKAVVYFRSIGEPTDRLSIYVPVWLQYALDYYYRINGFPAELMKFKGVVIQVGYLQDRVVVSNCNTEWREGVEVMEVFLNDEEFKIEHTKAAE